MVGALVVALIGDKVDTYTEAGIAALLISDPITWFNKILLSTFTSTLSTVTFAPSEAKNVLKAALVGAKTV